LCIAVPIAAIDHGQVSQLLGSGFVAGHKAGVTAVVTCLHVIGNATSVGIVIPPHGGDCRLVQPYPSQFRWTGAEVDLVDHINDLAVLTFRGAAETALPRFIPTPNDVGTGEEVVVLGYPFAPLGSILETWTPGFITALGRRDMLPGVGRRELVLSVPAHPGSSGSPVLRRSTGFLCGVVRGSLALPEVLRVGQIPIGTDSSVTFATSADIIPELLETTWGLLGV
jgi:S1-C subfamily serine protease